MLEIISWLMALGQLLLTNGYVFIAFLGLIGLAVFTYYDNKRVNANNAARAKALAEAARLNELDNPANELPAKPAKPARINPAKPARAKRATANELNINPANELSANELKCEVCSKTFDNYRKLNGHKRVHRKDGEL